MKQTSNKDMLNAIRNQASAEYKEKVPVMMSEEMTRALPTTLQDYPTIKNEFIHTLMNKVVRTDFFSKVYENPLKMLKKGTLAYGASIEELFVRAAEAKGFFGSGYDQPNYDGLHQPTPTELLEIKEPIVDTLYITKNFAHFFQTSISDSQLKSAFTSQNGLSELVNQITSSLINGAEQKEFNDMKSIITTVCDQKRVKTDGKGKISTSDDIPKGISGDAASLSDTQFKTSHGVKQVIYKYNIGKDPEKGSAQEGKEVAKAIRSLAGRLKFVSSKYNMAGVETWTNPEDLVFITTPEIMANIDVEVLAQAFNVSSTDVNVRTILVDELPEKWTKGKKSSNFEADRGFWANDATSRTQGATCYGLLVDKDFIQAYDTVNEARQFENGRTLTTNLFLHRQGIMANCYFSNAIAIFNNTEFGKVKPE